MQSPGRSDMSRDDSNLGDDSSSIGAKDDDDDDDDDDGIEEGSGGDPERLKAFNVSIEIDTTVMLNTLEAVRG